MKFWDHHTHHSRCHHAEGSIEDYIISAIDKGLCQIGISDHFPMQFIPEEAKVWLYSMIIDEFPVYLKECRELKEKYREKIDVNISSEVDYFTGGFMDMKKQITPFLDEFDYIIGSIHVIFIDGHAWGVDNDDNPMGLGKFGTDKVYKNYYEQQVELVKTGFYNIIGHCDLPKKYGHRPVDQDAIWQKQLNLLDALEQSNMAMEINTSGFYKPVYEQYPEDKMIQEAINRKIPICIGSDAHSPTKVGYQFKVIEEKVKKMGLKSLAKFKNKEMSLIPLD